MRTGDLLFHTLGLRGGPPAAELAVGWRSTDAGAIPALMDYEQGALWLQRRLRESGADATAPSSLIQALRERSREAAAKNLLVDAEAARIIARLAANGVPHVLIKGLARRAGAARYPCADARSTNDVDIIVPRHDAQRAWDDLVSAGYRRISDATSPHHLPPLIAAGNVGVELHTSLAHALPPDEAWRRATAGAAELSWNGCTVRIPAATELLWHGLSHAVREEAAAFRLRYLLDGASVLAGSEPIDWREITRRLESGEVATPLLARAWLAAAGSLAGIVVDAGVTAGAGFDVARSLRWKLGVLSRRRDEGLGARLLEEGARLELGLPPATVVPASSVLKKLRRGLGGRAARVMYRWWRAREGREAA